MKELHIDDHVGPLSSANSSLRWPDDIARLDDVSLAEIAGQVGTPFYAYSAAGITGSHAEFTKCLGDTVKICYAVKANSNLAVLKLLVARGCGMDIVSGGELERVLAVGANPAGIIFSGVGKTSEEIRAALTAGIHQFNVESVAELHAISAIAVEERRRAPVALRVNPDVDAGSHDKISTGRKGDKFGIDIHEVASVYSLATQLPGIDTVGLAVHIGSQILKTEPYEAAYRRMARLVEDLRSRGLSVRRLDLGGGFGISYGTGTPLRLDEYADVLNRTVIGLDLELTIEPGRRMVGAAGLLVATVLYVKPGEDADIVIVDAAMNDCARPAMYGAIHPVVSLTRRSGAARKCTIVGPVCETGDSFGSYCDLPQLVAGDQIAFTASGAYGAAMSSTYNSRALVPEVLIENGTYGIIRRRQSIAEAMSLETAKPSMIYPG